MNQRRIRVLHLIKCLDRGGAERLLTSMLPGGDTERFAYEVAFVRSDMRGLVSELEAAGIPVHDLGATSDLDLSWTARLRRLLIDSPYDVMHSHLPYAAGLGRLVARSVAPRRRPRLVYTEHSLWGEGTRAARLLRRTTSHLDDVSIAVAETNRAALPPAIRRRTRVIVHGVDLDRTVAEISRDSIRAALGIPSDHLVAISVANLTAQKGYPTLLAAARLLVDAGLPVTFLAAGAGPLEHELHAEHARLGLAERFRFLGQRADAHSLIAASDVLVLASNWECMPVVVMEAFALGTPVVATAVGDLPGVIDSGVNGILVPPRRPDLLAAELGRLLADPRLRAELAAAGADMVGRFDARRASTALEAVYADLVAL